MKEVPRKYRGRVDHLLKGLTFLKATLPMFKERSIRVVGIERRLRHIVDTWTLMADALDRGHGDMDVQLELTRMDVDLTIEWMFRYFKQYLFRRRDATMPTWTIPIPLDWAKLIASLVVDRVLKGNVTRHEVAGSIRRRELYVEDVDIVAVPEDMGRLQAAVLQLDPQAHGGMSKVFFTFGLKVDLVLTQKEWFGAQLFETTGPAGYVIAYRKRARDQGKLLNNKGLYERLPGNKTGRRVAGRSEQSIYKALGKKYKSPWERGS